MNFMANPIFYKSPAAAPEPEQLEGGFASRGADGEAVTAVQERGGAGLIQTRSSEDGPALESSLEAQCARVGMQVDVEDKDTFLACVIGWIKNTAGKVDVREMAC